MARSMTPPGSQGLGPRGPAPAPGGGGGECGGSGGWRRRARASLLVGDLAAAAAGRASEAPRWEPLQRGPMGGSRMCTAALVAAVSIGPAQQEINGGDHRWKAHQCGSIGGNIIDRDPLLGTKPSSGSYVKRWASPGKRGQWDMGGNRIVEPLVGVVWL